MFVLWYRRTKRDKWRIIGRADTSMECMSIMATCGMGGEFLTLEDGQHPEGSK